MRVVAILLAAGASTRFGAAKLETLLNGIPLGLHAARTLNALPLVSHLVVTGSSSIKWPGFEPIPNDAPMSGISLSVRLGLGRARQQEPDAVLIALADMPFVPKIHFERLLTEANGSEALVASTDGATAGPPCVFGSAWFDRLDALRGDRGARDLLDQATLIQAPPGALCDIDRRSDIP